NNEDRFLFISYDQSSLTHGLHKYPAKFFPELPRWLIKRYSKENDTIIDPFTGSATTNIEALLSKRHSVGIDISPFSRFIAKVKVTPLDITELEICKERVLNLLVNYRPEKVSEEDIPVFPYRDNWFIREIILELAYIKKCINNLDTDEDIKDFLMVCFSSIIRSVSNADDNCTRTVIRKKLNKVVNPADALRKFAEAILINIPKITEFSRLCPDNIEVTFPDNMDARNIKYDEDTFDLALTSPPYANAVDYPRTHQLETYWLGFARDSLIPLKKKQVGTESVYAKDYKKLHSIGVKEADAVISKIYKKDQRRAYIVYKYLEDMQKNLAEIYRVLKTNGKYIIVVGNNRIRGELFENWKYIIKLAEKKGFTLENYFISEIINHFIKVPREERIDADWILVFRK
ncbi:hypothetical protein GF312_10410, partial [Candidatus Poribacteria bacterium]|nr:hypothetical protein [Candidatus Poribacteria bacterium]